MSKDLRQCLTQTVPHRAYPYRSADYYLVCGVMYISIRYFILIDKSMCVILIDITATNARANSVTVLGDASEALRRLILALRSTACVAWWEDSSSCCFHRSSQFSSTHTNATVPLLTLYSLTHEPMLPAYWNIWNNFTLSTHIYIFVAAIEVTTSAYHLLFLTVSFLDYRSRASFADLMLATHNH